MEHCWLLVATYPPTKLKSRTVCCQEGEDDEDMTPSDTTIAYKVRLLLFFHSDFWHNSLGSTCTCHYLLVGTNMSQSASPSKLNCQFVCRSTLLHWESHNSFIRSAIEVNKNLMEILLDNISNRSCPTSISH